MQQHDNPSAFPVIEKGVAMPPRTGGRKQSLPFADMQVGDSFALPKSHKQATAVSGLAASWARTQKLPYKFAQRTIGDTIRLWRVA